MTIQEFKIQAKKWESRFWKASIFTSTLIICVYLFFKKDAQWQDPMEWVSLIAITLVGVIGSFASTFSYFFAIRIAYDSIISGSQNEALISKMDTVMEQVALIGKETNSLTKSIADSTQKSFTGLENILPELADFLQQNEFADELFILTDSACIGEIFLEGSSTNPVLQTAVKNIQEELIKCARSCKHLEIATLSTKPNIDDDELLNQYIQPLSKIVGILDVAQYFKSHLHKHHSILQQMHAFVQVKIFDIENLPFQFIIKRNGEDYTGIFILVGGYNITDWPRAKAILIDHDEAWLNNLIHIFKKITKQK